MNESPFRLKNLPPVKIISGSFALIILVGTLLLMLPISSRQGMPTDLVSSLFTATSATCVTGLLVFDTYTHWSLFGQGVILALIQAGGLGLLTFASFFNMVLGRKLSLRGMQLASESINAISFGDVPRMLRMVILFTLVAESIGAMLLSLEFVPAYGLHGVLISVFLSVSAFCNAGFDILGFQGEFISLCNYNDSYLVLFTIMGLIVVGGLGFLVWSDLLSYKKGHKFMLHTKIVLIFTALLIVSGAILFALFEWENPHTLGPLSLKEKIGACLFQSVTLRTAGFNTIDASKLYDITKTISILYMFIGAAPGSTGGGIKVTTMAVIIMTAVSMIRGKDEPMILNRRIPAKVIYRSISIVFLGVLVVCITSGIISASPLIDDVRFTGVDAVFESVSAFATVGISSGISPVAGLASKLALSITMFIGRVGPVAFGMTIASQRTSPRRMIIPEGKILVG